MILIVTLTVAVIGVIVSILLYVQLKKTSNRSRLDANLRNFSFQQIKNDEKNDALEVERY